MEEAWFFIMYLYGQPRLRNDWRLSQLESLPTAILVLLLDLIMINGCLSSLMWLIVIPVQVAVHNTNKNNFQLNSIDTIFHF